MKTVALRSLHNWMRHSYSLLLLRCVHTEMIQVLMISKSIVYASLGETEAKRIVRHLLSCCKLEEKIDVTVMSVC